MCSWKDAKKTSQNINTNEKNSRQREQILNDVELNILSSSKHVSVIVQYEGHPALCAHTHRRTHVYARAMWNIVAACSKQISHIWNSLINPEELNPLIVVSRERETWTDTRMASERERLTLSPSLIDFFRRVCACARALRLCIYLLY